MSKKDKNCIDCGRLIWNTSKRCRSCTSKRAIFTDEHRERIRLSKLGQKNPNWIGDAIKSKTAIHNWIRRRMPKPVMCPRCGERPALDLANKSGSYHRDVNDFEWLCRRCHMLSDGRFKNLWKGTPIAKLERGKTGKGNDVGGRQSAI